MSTKTGKEPIRNWRLWAVFGVIFLLGVPWYLPQGSYKPVIFGFPYWVVIVLVMSVALSLFLTYVLTYEWQMVEEQEHASSGKEEQV